MKQFPLIICTALAVILFSIFLSLHSEIRTMAADLQFYHTNYLSKQGGTSLYDKSGKMTIYDLRSFDGGKAWYAVHKSNDTLVIDGDADKVFPGLMTELNATDSLFNHIQTNGQLNLANSNDLKLLKDVGFTITSNRNKTNFVGTNHIHTNF